LGNIIILIVLSGRFFASHPDIQRNLRILSLLEQSGKGNDSNPPLHWLNNCSKIRPVKCSKTAHRQQSSLSTHQGSRQSRIKGPHPSLSRKVLGQEINLSVLHVEWHRIQWPEGISLNARYTDTVERLSNWFPVCLSFETIQCILFAAK
jgi:hypothetical protein